MALPNAYAQYKNSKVMTASPAELTLMLYDGAIKYCNIATDAVEKNDIQRAHDNILRVQRIVEYLRATLNPRYPVARDFENIYNYLLRRLVDANMKKDKAILDEINGHLHSVRDTWKEVMRANNVRVPTAM